MLLSHLPTALKTRLGLILAKAVAMRVMINATGCPAPVSDRASMKTHARISDLIASAIDHDLHTPFGLPLWASLSAFYRS